MEQRIYHGEVSPGELADHLVQQYDPRPELQAQKLGDIWDSIDLYMASRGATRGPDQRLAHPHAG